MNTVSEDEDPELYYYLIQLRETLVECYTTIVHGVTEPGPKQYLA